jgi:hypothetical protein
MGHPLQRATQVVLSSYYCEGFVQQATCTSLNATLLKGGINYGSPFGNP